MLPPSWSVIDNPNTFSTMNLAMSLNQVILKNTSLIQVNICIIEPSFLHEHIHNLLYVSLYIDICQCISKKKLNFYSISAASNSCILWLNNIKKTLKLVDCLAIYGIPYPDTFFFMIHQSTRN